MASPSPVADGKRLFAFFGTGDVFCFDLDGGLLWQRAIADEYGPFENRFAAASSPLLFEDKLIVQCDHYGASYVIALDQQTGANRWKSDRPEVWLSWCPNPHSHHETGAKSRRLASGRAAARGACRASSGRTFLQRPSP